MHHDPLSTRSQAGNRMQVSVARGRQHGAVVPPIVSACSHGKEETTCGGLRWKPIVPACSHRREKKGGSGTFGAAAGLPRVPRVSVHLPATRRGRPLGRHGAWMEEWRNATPR